MRGSRWGVEPCGWSCCLLVGVVRSLASSNPPLPLLRICCRAFFPLHPLLYSRFRSRSCSRPNSCSRARPRSHSRPCPVHVPTTVPSLLSLMPCPPFCTTSLDRHRISGPKLLATSRHHITPTEMMPRAEQQCLVFYSSYFPMRRIPEFSSFPPSFSLLVLVLVLSSVTVSTPISLPVSVNVLVSHPASVPVPVLRSFSRLRPRPLFRPHP